MANLIETNQWPGGIYQIELVDPVLGGPPDLAQGQGISNVPAQQLADRTLYLKTRLDALLNGADPALDTLNEIAAALNDDANFAATMLARLGGLGGQANSVADLDALNKSGLFEVAVNAVGNPVPGTSGGVVHIENSGGRAQQTVVSDNGNTYSRQRIDATPTWSAWRNLWDDGNAPVVLAGTGYQKLPSGLILQWGSEVVGASANGLQTTATFPIAFPTACLRVYPVLEAIGGGFAGVPVIYNLSHTLTTATFVHAEADPGNENIAVEWLAIGH